MIILGIMTMLRNIFFLLLSLPVTACYAQVGDTLPKDKQPAPDDFQIVDQEPKCINLDTLKKGLQFPDSLKQTGSSIFIKLLINKDGIPIRHIVKRSPHPLITAEFERHIYHLRFTPALKDGQPLLFWVSLPVQWCNRR